MAGNPRIDDLRKRLDKEPGSRLFAQLAEELRKEGELAEAIQICREGLQKHSNYPSARMTLGRALLDTGDYASARLEFESVLKTAPDNILASRFLGEALEGVGDLGGARERYKLTLAMAPGEKHVAARLEALDSPAGAPPRAAATAAPAASPAVPASAPAPVAASAPAPEPEPAPAAEPAPIPLVAADEDFEIERPYEAKATGWGGSAPTAPEPDPEPDFEIERPHEARTAQWGAVSAPPPPPAVPVESRDLPDVAPPPAAAPAAPAAQEAQAAPAAPAAAPPAAAPTPEPPREREQEIASATLAEIYFNQGFPEKAIAVYQQVLLREPGNERARARLQELELPGTPAAVEAVAAPADGGTKRERIERTIDKLEGLLGAMKGGRQ